MLKLKKIISLALALSLMPALISLANAEKPSGNKTAAQIFSAKAAKSVPLPTAPAAVRQVQQDNGGQYAYNPPAPAPGKDISPKIEDQNRLSSILELIGKIHRGEKLAFARDGIVFQNRENKLPPQVYGFYHEYTLLPPGEYPAQVVIGGVPYALSAKLGKRGAERIVIGGGRLIYYSPDHYRTFIELRMVY